jgi:hypothetical protein
MMIMPRNLPEHCSEFPRALEVHRVEQDVNPGHPNPRLTSKRTTWSSVTQILLHYWLKKFWWPSPHIFANWIWNWHPWTLGVIPKQKCSYRCSPTDFFLLTWFCGSFIFSAVDHTSDEVFFQELAKLVLYTGDVLIEIGDRRDEVGFLMPGVGASVVNCQSVRLSNQMTLPNQCHAPHWSLAQGYKFSGWPPISVCMWCTLNAGIRTYVNTG